MKYDEFVDSLIDELEELMYENVNYQYEVLNGMHQRFTLPNGVRVTV